MNILNLQHQLHVIVIQQKIEQQFSKNTLCKSQFNIELEENRRLPFLDTMTTAISNKVVLEKSAKVEYEGNRLAGDR
jgi:hypothetical protein